jgi:hypothetical protein
MFRRLLAFVLFATFAVNQARADLALNLDGVTDVGSSLAGNPISPGTSFEVQAIFPNTPVGTITGEGLYMPTSITAVVGGTSYSVSTLSNFYVQLIDPAYGHGFQYISVLENATQAFEPEYTTATPALDATAATPTVFSGYYGSDTSGGSTSLTMSTAAGDLTLVYNAAVGVSSSITNSVTTTAVPEPSTLHIAVLGGLAGAGIALIRRRRAVAVA